MRPARSLERHDPYRPGLHHLCLRVATEQEVREAATRLKENKIILSEAKYYPEYAPDYFAVFFADPDGLQLEITNFREERRQRHAHWDTEY